MAIIPQKQLFSWQDIEDLGDLKRLQLVLEYMPDEALMVELESERGQGRNDYPIRAVWNSVLAGIVLQHPSVESLRRELQRNAQLRQLCGFDVLRGAKAVPSSSAYTRFLHKLCTHHEQLEAMFGQLVEALSEELDGFGKLLAIDGKAIESHARGRKRNTQPLPTDGRRDTDANWGKKQYRGERDDGTPWKKTVTWFGYQLSLLVDATYELPVGFEVTRASASEIKQGHRLIAKVAKQTPGLLQSCEFFLGDRGYDDTKLIQRLWQNHGIKPVIDIRNQWKDGEKTRLVTGQENVVYDYRGQVYCHCPASGKRREMAYGGFEKDRETLKYRCPAQHYEISCRGQRDCPVKKAIRISLTENPRVFTPLARSSYRFEALYKRRTAVERVNSRLDQSFGFEQHFIRGLAKMKARCSMALVVMLAMALGRIREKNKENLRSLVKAA